MQRFYIHPDVLNWSTLTQLEVRDSGRKSKFMALETVFLESTPCIDPIPRITITKNHHKLLNSDRKGICIWRGKILSGNNSN